MKKQIEINLPEGWESKAKDIYGLLENRCRVMDCENYKDLLETLYPNEAYEITTFHMATIKENMLFKTRQAVLLEGSDIWVYIKTLTHPKWLAIFEKLPEVLKW